MRAAIRTLLIRCLNQFIQYSCHYNYQEREAVKELLELLQPVDWEKEKFNLKHAKERAQLNNA
jgi:hypothetical protein